MLNFIQKRKDKLLTCQGNTDMLESFIYERDDIKRVVIINDDKSDVARITLTKNKTSKTTTFDKLFELMQ